MHRNHGLVATLFILLAVSTLQAQNAKPHAKRPEVPIASTSGVKLRVSPSMKAKVIKVLGVGDAVEVLKQTPGESGAGTTASWAFVKFVRSPKGDWPPGQKGWVLDRDLGYPKRFKKITSWKQQRISGGAGDYAFTLEINRDGSFAHKYTPCVDCGEKPDCDRGERKVGGECVSRGHLYRYGNFVWAKKPTVFQEYFFINKRGALESVYPEDK